MTAEHAKPCPACSTPLLGRWCYACGQDTEVRPHPLRDMATEAIEAITSFDSRVLRTVVAMVTRPYRILESYRSGASGVYVTPLKLFVVVTALFLATMALTGVVMVQNTYKIVEQGASLRVITYPGQVQDDLVRVEGARSDEIWLQPPVVPQVDPQVMSALQAAAIDPARTAGERAEVAFDISQFDNFSRAGKALSDWLPHLLWLLMPLHALALAPFFGWKRLLAEHLAFAMWAHAMLFGLLALVALINRAGAGLDPEWAFIPYLGFFIVTARRYYAQGWFGAAWKTLIHTFVYIFLILTPVAVVVLMLSMDWSVYGHFLAEQMRTP